MNYRARFSSGDGGARRLLRPHLLGRLTLPGASR
jgi:hypothetical protein